MAIEVFLVVRLRNTDGPGNHGPASQGYRRQKPAPLRLIEPSEKEVDVIMKGLDNERLGPDVAPVKGKADIRNGVQENESR
jgi:hypothetical protein